MKKLLIDTGFWIALFTEDDKYFERANKTWGIISKYKLIVPWPTMYETLNTRFVNKVERFVKFRQAIKKQNVSLIEDSIYKENAWSMLLNDFPPEKGKKHPSFVDGIIREMLIDKELKIDYLVTYNPSDFSEVCNQHKITLLDYVPDEI
jgi:predicted nucleic acid-binding protein